MDSGQGDATISANYTTMRQQLTSDNANARPFFAAVQVSDTKYVEAVTRHINQLKDGKHLAFVGVSIGDMLDTINTITDLAADVLAAIAAISLLVSALMIIVTMYMSVSERTKEIGILRALGESKRDVRRLFTSESLFIGLSSAALGTVMAYGLGAVLNMLLWKVAKFDMIDITPRNVVFALLMAIIISFLAALLPARRAARLNPIDALSVD